jgi:hypothetical protein
MTVWDTDVFHESIKWNLNRMLSIRRKYCLEETMLQSHYDVIYMRCCDFSMDLGEIAKFEHLAAPFRLRQSQRSLSATFRNYQRFAFFIPLALCCMISIIQSEVE